MKLTIIGGGSFGTALAVRFAQTNQVTIWEFFEENVKEMLEKRESPFLPGVSISPEIQITSVLAEAVENAEAILMVIPSKFFADTMRMIKPLLTNQKIIICTKGFSSDHGLLSQISEEILEQKVWCLYGPTIAGEFAQLGLSGMVLAGESDELLMSALAADPLLKLEHSTDIIGAQTGAALKNVVTIMVGISEGMEMGENTKAYFFTKGINEIAQIGKVLGADPCTFYGLTCVGDLSLNSRNRKLGIKLGQGKTLQQIEQEDNHLYEGVEAVKHAEYYRKKFKLHLPIIETLYKILYEDFPVSDILTKF